MPIAHRIRNVPMNVAIFSPYATVAPHFETELEIAQKHLDSGDQVRYVACMGQLANCDFNRNLDPDRCRDCIGRREAGTQLVELNAEPLVPCRRATSDLKREFESLTELTAYHIDNFDIGYAALSSLVSLIRDPEPDLSKHKDLLARFLAAAKQTYDLTIEFVRKNRPDRVYVFNGRFAAMRAVLRACQRMEVDCYLHERGCDQGHYEIFENHMPHDITAIDQTIRRMWEQAADKALRDQQARQWFEDRVARVEKNWHSFVKNQESGRLPADWNPAARNISIFNSSDDEFVAIGDHWRNELYENQWVALRQIAGDLHNVAPDTKIYLRVHPNLSQVNNRRKQLIMALDFPNLTVIPPDANIDTYELMRRSETVATFGSSVGIEAAYWGVPSVLLGPCLYQHLDGTYQPKTHTDALELLTKPLMPKEKKPAMMYGYWLQTRGRPYDYFEADGLFSGRFRGHSIYPGARICNATTKVAR